MPRVHAVRTWVERDLGVDMRIFYIEFEPIENLGKHQCPPAAEVQDSPCG